MPLTTAQLQVLRDAINANPVWSATSLQGDGPFELAQMLNSPASPAFVVWHSAMPTIDIVNATNQTRYTPNDAIAQANTDTASLMRLNGRALYAQTKLMVFQNFVLFRESLDMRKVRVRVDLQDCLTNVPSGNNGNVQHPGGTDAATVLGICVRNATEAEKIFAAAQQANDTTGTVTARVTTWEGQITTTDIVAARNLP